MATEGSPSQIFAEQLKIQRDKRGMSQRELSDRLKELGAPIEQSTIARTEKMRRGVPLDDAFAMAAALDVSPVHLFAGSFSPGNVIAVTSKIKLSSGQAREWLRGRAPLPQQDARTFHSEVSDEEFFAQAQLGVERLYLLVERFVNAADDEERAGVIDKLNDELEAQRDALKRRLDEAARVKAEASKAVGARSVKQLRTNAEKTRAAQARAAAATQARKKRRTDV